MTAGAAAGCGHACRRMDPSRREDRRAVPAHALATVPAGPTRPDGDDRPTTEQARGPRVADDQPRAVRAGVRRARRVDQRIVEAAAVLPGVRRRHRLGGTALARATMVRRASGVGGIELPGAGSSRTRRHPAPAGIAVSAERLDAARPRRVDGVPITTPVRSVVLRDAVRRELAATPSGHSTWRRTTTWSRSTRWRTTSYAAPGLDRHPAVPRGPSRWPTRTAGRRRRSTCAWSGEIDADLPRPLCNRPIFDRRGSHIGTPDLLDVGGRGRRSSTTARSTSKGPAAARRTVARTLFRGHGLEYFTMVAADRRRPGRDRRTGCIARAPTRRVRGRVDARLDRRTAALVDATTHRCRCAVRSPRPATRRLLRYRAGVDLARPG